MEGEKVYVVCKLIKAEPITKFDFYYTKGNIEILKNGTKKIVLL
jgi:hypothetical protein